MSSIDKRSMNLLFNTSFPKDSFDRFGDDLTELIVSYLWFEDKLRLQCVSKQWRRYVYQKQYGLVINNLDSKQTISSLRQLTRRNSDQSNDRIDRKALESILKKCRFITTIWWYSDINSEVFALIGRYCHYLYSLYIRNGVKSMNTHSLLSRIGHYLWSFFSWTELSFYQKYGHKLTGLYIYQDNRNEEDNEEIKKFLQFCPNVTKVFVPEFSFLLKENKEFLPKVNIIYGRFVYSSEIHWNEMKILSEKYWQTLNTFYVQSESLSAEELKTCVDCICRLENLKQLEIIFNS